MNNDHHTLKSRVRAAMETGNEKELLELISVESERLVARAHGPGELMEALVESGAHTAVPTAAERHHHAFLHRVSEIHREDLARCSPIFALDGGTMVAAPVGRLGQDGFLIFTDRLLARVLEFAPAMVFLLLDGFDAHEGAPNEIAALKADLKEQKIKMECK